MTSVTTAAPLIHWRPFLRPTDAAATVPLPLWDGRGPDIIHIPDMGYVTLRGDGGCEGRFAAATLFIEANEIVWAKTTVDEVTLCWIRQ